MDVQTHSNNQVILVDSNALIHRAYHAYPPTLKTAKGVQTNAVFGFTAILLDIWKSFKPKYMVCTFDTGKPTFRHKKYAEYKGTRKPTDPELIAQFPLAMEVVKAFNIPLLFKDGYEADDLIGTLSRVIDHGVQKIIVTGDQDIFQLIDSKDDKTFVYMAGTSFSAGKLYDEAGVELKLGISPQQVVEYKALLGDPSDNIPGVKGIGKKGAVELLKQFTTLDALYESLESGAEIWQTSPWKRMAAKLTDGKKDAYMSRELATIIRDVPLEFSLSDAVLADFDKSAVVKLFQEYQFRSLLNKIPASSAEENFAGTGESASSAASGGPTAQMDIFAGPGGAEALTTSEKLTLTIKNNQYKYNVVNEEVETLEALDELAKADILAFDFETDSLDIMRAKPLGLGISIAEGTAVYLGRKALGSKKVKQKILKVFSDPKKVLVAHNLKFDLHMLNNLGVEFSKTDNCFDTLVAAFLLNAGNPLAKGLKDLAFNEFGMLMVTIEQFLKEQGRGSKVEQIPENDLGLYCCMDSDATLRLYHLFKVRLEADPGLLKIFREIEMPLEGILLRMERLGVVVDTKELEILQDEAEQLVKDLETKIYSLAGEEFNINSPRQVGEILFTKLKIQDESPELAKTLGKTKNGSFSTDERVLRNFSLNHEIVQCILDYRELNKLISTYLIALKAQVDEVTGRIHTSYNQAIASTGRLSSINPNLQNIPIVSDIGRKIRKAFLPGDDRLFVSLDYAQQELRLLAHLSEEPKLIDAFQGQTDIHSLTAAEILGIDLDKVTKNERRIGKTVNFGVIYGISPFGLADRLKIEQSVASDFIQRFFARYPKVYDYFENLKLEASTSEEVRTLLGRRRDSSGMNDRNFHIRSAVTREIINFPLQGGAADIMKLAMLQIDAALATGDIPCADDINLHLQVHDELIFSMRKGHGPKKIEEAVEALREIMTNAYKLKVPIVVDSEVGDSWYDLQPLAKYFSK